MPKPENVVKHWHFFPKDEVEDDNNKRVDVCEQSDGNIVVWILETNVDLNFDNLGDALVFVKMFMLGRHIKPAVDIANNQWFNIHSM
jgi:hypothetical protein